MFVIPTADSLVTYLKDFTGSSNDNEIKQCIFQAELSMRNIELPALRTDPYTTFGVVGTGQLMPIPSDMNKPILFFQQGTNGNANDTGPWIVYDRIGDRDIITQGLIAQLYLTPVNVPAVIRGKFSEVGSNYQFLPYLAEGAIINMYYYRAWDLLFTPSVVSTIISTTGTVGAVGGTAGAWTFPITGMTDVNELAIGDVITVTASTGSFGTGNEVTITGFVSATSVTCLASGGTTAPVAGTVANITKQEVSTVQTNPVLQTWPEGYIYNSLHEYYTKRHSIEDANMYKQKAIDAWKTVEDQNNLGKWSGGHTRLTSIFQPRRDRQYAVK
jgi:hypothetical protein